MADLYGTIGLSSSLESEEMSAFLHNLLHNSSATPSSSPWTSFKAKHMHSFSSLPPPPLTEENASPAGLVGRSVTVLPDSDCRLRDGASTTVADSSSNLNFSDPFGFFPSEAKDSILKSVSSAGAVDSDVITSSMKKRRFLSENGVNHFGFGCKGPKASEVPDNRIPPRSSKRSRATEIHNLSEKRRRSRINEKLKALQNLIPNSNKTDKASMLDEAIEYLKQLQLQVQTLTMSNGLSMHPIYLPDTLQLAPRGMDFEEGNGLLYANRGGDTFSGNQEISIQTAFAISNQIPQNQPIVVPSVTNITNSETSFGLESIQNQYGFLNHLTSSKVTSS